MGKINFRSMKKDEYKTLIEIWNAANLPFKSEGRDSEQNILSQLEIPSNNFIFAEFDNKVVGVIVATHNGRKGWINRLAVIPEFRKKGIANALIKEAEIFFQNANIEIYACLIENYNNSSMKLFTKNDYTRHDDIIYYTKRMNNKV